jgi:hypothetical protein
LAASFIYRQNADNCSQLAEAATTDPACQRFKRMKASWRPLVTEQDWLDGQIESANP